MKHLNPTNEQFQHKLDLRALKQTPLRVLAVDDEADILDLLHSTLTEFHNCDVTTAASADAAVKAIKSADRPFDCLLLDIQMPGTNGIDLLRQIRSLPCNVETPAIMLTAMNDRDHVEQAFLQGAFDYITKPFDLFELRSRMNAAQLLMQERAKVKRTQTSVKALRQELDYKQQFSFDDPFSLGEVNRCLRYVEFDNYVQGLSRARQFDSWATAIKVQDAEYRYDLNDFGDFRRMITDVGRSLKRTTSDADAVFSYRGSGTFLIITHGKTATAQLPTEEQLARQLDRLQGAQGATSNISMVMSRPVAMRSLSRTGVSDALSRSIARVNEKEQALRTGTLPKTAPKPEAEATRKKPRVNLFEQVMRELYGEKSYLSRK